MGLEAILGKVVGKGDSDEEASEPAAKSEKTGYRTLLKEAAADGDWDGVADAIVGLCKQHGK